MNIYKWFVVINDSWSWSELSAGVVWATGLATWDSLIEPEFDVSSIFGPEMLVPGLNMIPMMTFFGMRFAVALVLGLLIGLGFVGAVAVAEPSQEASNCWYDHDHGQHYENRTKWAVGMVRRRRRRLVPIVWVNKNRLLLLLWLWQLFLLWLQLGHVDEDFGGIRQMMGFGISVSLYLELALVILWVHLSINSSVKQEHNLWGSNIGRVLNSIKVQTFFNKETS